jgi:D-alanyl-lipoteichoic acid acyltransferase DltB (MBOAT superfamily)
MWWKPELIVLILISALVNYTAAICIENIPEKRRLWLIISLVINFGILFFFKYLGFVSESIEYIYGLLGLNYPVGRVDIILPMGISFYTFQAASYTIDVYYGRYKAERNYFKLTLFITFFPQLVAGPIERADRLLGQLFEKHSLNASNISIGLKLMVMGYFKKIVIADRAAMLVDSVYNGVGDFKGLPLIIATLLFTVQIYCDFSGYSDIARGTAKLMGIDLMLNFDRPYFSASIKEFWHKWHISLSSWLRDYVYIPLGGSRCSVIRKYINLMITFLASGLWHGANWTFVLWGGLHGIYQIIGDIKDRIFGDRLKLTVLKPFRILITFLLVVFAWIFFRSNNIGDAIYVVQNLFTDMDKVRDMQYLYEMFNSFGLTIYELMLLCGSICVLILSELVSKSGDIHIVMGKLPFVVRFVYYYILVAIILTMGVFASGGQFIYFQF